MGATEWMTIAKEFGIPMSMVLVMGYGLFRVATWMAERVATPLVERHIRFLDRVEGIFARQAESMSTVTHKLDVLIQQQTEESQKLEEILTCARSLDR